MDFIVKLPASKDPATGVKYNSILTVVDRLTKYTKYIPWKETWTAEDLGHIILREVVSQHGAPKDIVSDRGSLFTSRFWETLTAGLGIKRKMSTAYHPQTDGQTEQMNQNVGTYL